MAPDDVTVVHIEREDRVARVRGDRAVAVAGADVNAPALRIDRWRIPDARARWTPQRAAARVLAEASKRFGNAVDLPEQFAGVGVECRDAASRTAAFVRRICARHRFCAGERNVETAVVKR